MKTTTTSTIATAEIYVGTYAKYNSGTLKGAWLTLSNYSSRDEFLDAARELHADEEDPELMFQDFQGFPRSWYSESSAPPETLWEWLELDESEQHAFALYTEDQGGDASIEDFRDAYQGTADSEADFAENVAQECGDIPKDLPSWIQIDWQASWDRALGYDYWSESDDNGELHFFRR